MACLHQMTTTVVYPSFVCRKHLSNVTSALRICRGTSLTDISPQAVTKQPSTRCCYYEGRKRSFRVIGRNCPVCGLHQVLLGEWGLDCMPWRLDIIVLWKVFTSTFMWWKSNGLTTDERRILLSVADFANHAKYTFCGHRVLSTGLQLQQKDQNHMAINHCCHGREARWRRKAPSFPKNLQIVNRWAKIATITKTKSSFHQDEDNWYFAKFLR